MKDEMKQAEHLNGEESSPTLSDSTRFKALVKASGLAIGADLFLIALKYALGVLTGSSVLFADALHSGGDLAVSVIVLCSIVVHYGFKDNGWARDIEALVALHIAFLLIISSITVMAGAFSNETARFRLIRGIPLVIAIGGISIALGVIFAMSRFKRQVGEQYASVAFIAEGMHTQSDFLTSAGVWLTLLLGYFNVHLERIMTLFVGLAVFHIGVRLFIRALKAFSMTPAVIERTKRLMPPAVKARLISVRQHIDSLTMDIRSVFSRFPRIREKWVLEQKYRLIVGNSILIGLLYFGTGFYTVLPHQTGLELFLGKVTEQNPPGLHIHAPKPFGDVVWVDTAVTARVESGFRTDWDFQGEEPEAYLWEFTHTEGRYRKVPEEAITITGDETLIDTNFLCYYRIVDPVQYAFNTENAHEILRSLFSREIHAELRHYRLEDLLTSERKHIQAILLEKMQQAVACFPLGVTILNVYMREAHPPVEVVPSYRAVASARENKIELIHTANTYANAILPLSRGQSVAVIAKAEGDAAEQFSTASENTQNFLVKQQIFRQTEAVQRVRLWWNTIEVALKDKALTILPQGTKRRVYSSETLPSDKQISKRKLGYGEDENLKMP